MTLRERLAMPNVTEETKVTISLYLTAILLVAVISIAFAAGIYKANIDSRLSSLEVAVVRHEGSVCADIAELNRKVLVHEERFDAQDVTLKGIETDVKWMRMKMDGE